MKMRKSTKKIKIGDIYIGGNERIAIQSMTNTSTENVIGTIKQINELQDIGCDIIRVAIPNMEAAHAIKEIKKNIEIPLVADIHFDYKLAIEAIINGADKIRINPGNIGDESKLKKVVAVAKDRNIPIRIGINAGSLEKKLLSKYGSPCPDAMVESALINVQLIESFGYDKIVLSIKSSDVLNTIESYTKLSQLVDYPLHIGITEAGTVKKGTVKSSIGIGCLLYKEIGDTIRVSLTGDPKEEVIVAREILRNLNFLNSGIEIVSCPTCGRCNVDLIHIANEIDNKIEKLHTSKKIKIAVMGCAVNGPGEAKDADLGIAGAKGEFLLFVKGMPIKKVSEEKAIDTFINELKKLL
jgi:(E)-4-hydroxy-3-methylbut-2-enyl-diphosphate synthase